MARGVVLLLSALLLCASAASPSQRSLVVHPNTFSDFAIPRRHCGLGIEFLNHELYGGLSTQMVFGESFEEASLASQARERAVYSRPRPHDAKRFDAWCLSNRLSFVRALGSRRRRLTSASSAARCDFRARRCRRVSFAARASWADTAL